MLLASLLCVFLTAAQAPEKAATFVKWNRTLPVGPQPCAIATADLTGNGLPDLVTADRGTLTDLREERPANDEISILLAQSKMEYQRYLPSLRSGFGPYALALANMDVLPWIDIVVANFHDTKHRDLSVFLNLRNDNVFKPLTFTVPDQDLPYNAQRDPEGNPLFAASGLTSLVVRDFNGDGFRDVCATAWASDQLVLFPGAAEGILGNPRLIPLGGGPRDIQEYDFDQDGKRDLAVVLYRSAEVVLLKHIAPMEFKEQARFPTGGRLPTRLRMADINADGRMDIVVSHSYTDDSIVIFYADNTPFSYTVSQTIRLGSDSRTLEKKICDILPGDFNNDGRVDIAATCHFSGEVVVLFNQSKDATIPQSFRKEIYTYDNGKPYALCTADFDQNGKPDLAVTLWEANAVAFLLGR